MVVPGPDGIDLDVWNDGIFLHEPLRYEDGVILKMYVARLSYEELRGLIKKSLMAMHMFGMYYRLPECDLEHGLVKIENDIDLIHMYDLSKKHGGIEMYIDHCDIDLTKHLAPPDPSILSDGTSAKRTTPRKRHCNVFTEEEMIHWAEEEVVDNGKGTDVGKGKGVGSVSSQNDKDKGKGKEILTGSSSESDGMLSSESDASDDSDYSNKSFDYLSPGEEELIQLRTRKANRTKERSIPIPDMTANPSRTRPNMSNRSEVLVEHDDFLSELVSKLKGDDPDANLQDPFVGVELTQDKYPVHDTSTHWKLKEPKLKENNSGNGVGGSESGLGNASGVGGSGRGSGNASGVACSGSGPPTVRRVNPIVQRGWRHWFGDDANYGSQASVNEGVQESQTEMDVPTQDEIPSQATNEEVQIPQEVQPLNVQLPVQRRLPSQRILQRKLTKSVHGVGSSANNAMNID
ncbi:hypothetical protein CTI12_AA082130 [Artemisia annua]|uniref:PB1-like domain-containing protein n=1 Tax=Artemisia annua TaxID=35608 RepID=A0A2U1Q2G4_ARTAN|nr:hypothetical protein CTI12_AA082130 [Artemisia annua]